ncbi:hypothetical protein EZV62_000158 [Acer yangbiense]|uniref:Uncharacterized protein n=1 Tax=Acer yangbiense TaxID=1000413 RepID=A0A5C7IR80_9ROSI|nr:hypothetical protein EZV62_000158 [Acer yangbiense]
MSSKKEDKSQAAAERIKAQALNAAKGLSRAQAERAAAAAARNVNAYGQKEEGPSRWQEKREAKRQMYLMSTEKAVRLGERKDLKTTVTTVGGAASQCQKCFQTGHWTFECKNERVYMSRPSRTQQLKNPKLKMKVSISYDLDNPEEEVKDEKAEKSSKKSKRKHRSGSDGGSDSEASVFETDSGSSSVTGSDYSSVIVNVFELVNDEVAENNCVYRNEVFHSVGERTQVLQDVAADPTLPRTKAVRCTKCQHGEAVFFQATSRGEEGQLLH